MATTMVIHFDRRAPTVTFSTTGGSSGATLYDTAKANGFTGTIQDFLASLYDDTVTIANLPANTITSVPTSTKIPSPKSITVFDGNDVDITSDIVIDKDASGKFTVASSVALTNLRIVLQN